MEFEAIVPILLAFIGGVLVAIIYAIYKMTAIIEDCLDDITRSIKNK